MRLTAIVHEQTHFGPTLVSPRHFSRVDAFAEAVGRSAAIPIPVMEGSLESAPSEGYLLAFAPFTTELAAVRGRVVYVEADRAIVPRVLEEQGLVAAIESHRYFEWKMKPNNDRGYGIFGRKDVAAKMGARLVSYGPPGPSRYSLLACPRYLDLPSFLAAYLVAYDEMLITATAPRRA